jgi:Plant calmodulin-binding domain
MATSKPTIDTAPRRASNPRPRTSPPTMPTVPSMRKPETAATRRNPNALTPLSSSTTKWSTAPFSKPVTNSTSNVKSPKTKKNPSPVIAPSRDKVRGLKSNKEGVQSPKPPSPKPPSPKPKTETAIIRSSSGIKAVTKVGNTSALIRGRSSVAGAKTVNKTGGATKTASKRSPSVGAKAGTKGSLTRVNSAPNLIEELIDIPREEVAEALVEEEKETNMSPDLDKKDEQTELIPVPLSMEGGKEGLIDIGGENEGRIETYAENDVNVEEKEPIEEVTTETVTVVPVPVPTIPVEYVVVPYVMAPTVPVSAVPVPVAQVAAATVPAHGKKEAGTSNAAIEETRSKLIGERKSRVLALVGAFESVM